VRFVLAALLAGCTDEIAHGTAGWVPIADQVYECAVGDGVTVEVCWAGEGATLARGIGAEECHNTPRHIGWCLHSCPPPESGCNAFNGCWCPE
jgi:hypothetical protein